MKKARYRAFALLFLIGCAGLTCTAVGYLVALRQDDARIRSVLDLRADWRAADLSWKLENLGQSVLAVAASIGSVPDLSLERIRRIDARPLVGQQALSGFAWLPRVSREERASFEAAIRSSGAGDFRILDVAAGSFVPAAERDAYFPITQAWIFDGQPAGIGFDVLGDPTVRAAAESARDTGSASATVPVRSPITGRITFVPIAPVYSGFGVPSTLDERRSRLRGYVIARVQLVDALNKAIEDTPPIPEDLYLFDASVGGGGMPFAEYQGAVRSFASAGGAVDLSKLDGFVAERPLRILGSDWMAAFHFSPPLIADERSVGLWGFVVAGLLATAGVMAMFWRESTAALRNRRLVIERTAELQRQTAERERIERTATAIIEQSPFAIIGLRPDRQVMLWNRAAERIFGHTADDAIGKPYALVPPEGEAEFDRIIERVSAGERLVDVEVARRHKDGHLVDIVFSGAPLYDAGGSLRGLIFVLQDVTERKAIEAQLRQSQKMEAIGQLSGGIAHDFNNMLGAIIGNLDLALFETKDVAAIHRSIESAVGIAVRGGQLVQRLLAFARRQMLAPKRIDIGAIVEEMLPLLRRSIGESVEVESELESGLWPVVADPSQLESALLNLSINARDAMPRGGTLTISAVNTTIDEDMAPIYPDLKVGDYVLIAVADTGTGMPPDVIARAFEPFFTTKDVGKGTGLGLSMVYGFLRQSGGTAKIYSELGHGTTVHLYLPRATDAADAPADAPVVEGAPRGTERVLVVEDNPEMRDVAASMLSGLGYAVLTAHDGAKALALVDAGERFDLLFSDVVMPGISGIELAKEIRRRRPQVRTLLTSGFASPVAVRDQAKEEGIELLPKPYRRIALAQKIRDVLDAPA